MKCMTKNFASRYGQTGYDQFYNIVKTMTGKHERHDALNKVKADFVASLPEESTVNKSLVDRYFHDVEKEAVRNLILNEGLRVDGRKTTDIRPIWCEVDYLPGAHGSAIFTRGETQSLTSVTLGTKQDEKEIDEVLFHGTEKFVLHYNFPPFSTGEAKASRGIGRREIGHGNLAHRALKRMIPQIMFMPSALYPIFLNQTVPLPWLQFVPVLWH